MFFTGLCCFLKRELAIYYLFTIRRIDFCVGFLDQQEHFFAYSDVVALGCGPAIEFLKQFEHLLESNERENGDKLLGCLLGATDLGE